MPDFTTLRQRTSRFFTADKLGQAITLAALLATGGLAPTTTWASRPYASSAPLAGATASLPPVLRGKPGRAPKNRTQQVVAAPTVTSFSPATTGATFSTTSRSPASNAVGVAPGTPVGITFSDVPTAASAANIRVFGNQAGGRRTLGAATVSGTTATLPVTGNAFRPGETVQVTVPATVLSTTGATAEPYAYQFTTATTPSSGRLGTKLADYPTGTQPADLGLGDVTGDGVPDLVVSNASDNTISVLAGRGNGTFGTRVNYAAGVAPYIIVLGDVNGDGRLDVLTTSQTTAAVTVLLATASGSLAAPSSYATLSNSSGAVLADFNRDGWLDIAATDGGTTTVPGTTVSVFLNTGNGNGTFGARSSYSTGSRPIAVGAGDMNGDGRPDLVTSNQTANTVSVLLGTGTGGFGVKTDYSVGLAPFIVTLGDLDNDADLDVVTCNQSANTVTVLRGTGTGTLAGRVDYTAGSSPQDVDLGDMNGDGRLDIVTADYTNNTVSILLGSATGFAKASYASATGPVSSALGDINGDGVAELVVGVLSPQAARIVDSTIRSTIKAACGFRFDRNVVMLKILLLIKIRVHLVN